MCSTQGTETIRLDRTTRREAATWVAAASLVAPTAARKAGGYVVAKLTQRVGTNSLRPVTVRQVLNASQPHSDAPFTFDDAELSQVTLVAWIQNIARNATNVSYTLDDGTGQLDVRQWIDNSADEGAKVDEFQCVFSLTQNKRVCAHSRRDQVVQQQAQRDGGVHLASGGRQRVPVPPAGRDLHAPSADQRRLGTWPG